MLENMLFHFVLDHNTVIQYDDAASSWLAYLSTKHANRGKQLASSKQHL